MEKKLQTQPTLFERIEKQHPFLTILYFAMTGSGILFLFLLVALTSALRKYDLSAFIFPKFFMVSTIVILISSYFAQKTWENFKNDEAKLLRQNLIYLLFLGILFSVAQYLGWQELRGQGIDFSGKPAGAYLYILTGLHILHLLGGLGFVLVQILHYQKACDDSVQALIIFSNKYEKMKMQLLRDYWHFLDLLWIAIALYMWLKL